MLHDVVIVGAGPVGATLALALAGSDLDYVVIDARAAGEVPGADRSLALSHGARLVFERLGVWGALAAMDGVATPITEIDISQAGGFGTARLAAAEQWLPALGYVVSYRALQKVLDAALARRSVRVLWGSEVARVSGVSAYAAVELRDSGDIVAGRLAAIAEGSGAAVDGLERKRHDYRQVALVARVWTADAHGGLAYERFTSDGPVALLPEHDHYGLVWTVAPETSKPLLAMGDDAFLAELSRHFGLRAPRFTRVADRRAFPLALERASATARSRCVVVGNAAQTLHPVAGQGFNLGLRDAYELARMTLSTPRDALGGKAMLDRYERARRLDRAAGIVFTHALVNMFGNDLPWVRWPRGVALALLDSFLPAKRAFTHAMIHGLR